MVIHAFGAYFGLALARTLYKKDGQMDNAAEGENLMFRFINPKAVGISNKLVSTLVHSKKTKPICTAIRPSSKTWKVILHRNKAKLENLKIFHHLYFAEEHQ